VPYAQDGIKACSACGSELPISAFHRNKRAKDGLNNQCKPCSRASRRKYRDGLGRCSVTDCTGRAVGNLAESPLCNTHYTWRRLGKDMEMPVRRRRANGEGTLNRQGYRVRMIDGRNVREHRWVMEQTLGRRLWPDENVHHKNGVRDDNRPENLELWVTHQPQGRRVDDLLDFVVSHYEKELRARLSSLDEE
jgi:hypothetical protein